ARVLVTGASRGIGEAIAREATRRGAKVIGVARSTGVLNGVMQSISGVAYPCDLSVDSERASLIERLEAVHGPIDVLINNAGVDDTKMFAQTSTLDVQRVITLNQIVPIELMRQALPRMQSRNRGHVVNISSLAAAGGFAGMTLYCSSKAGLSGFHRVLRHEMKGEDLSAARRAAAADREPDHCQHQALTSAYADQSSGLSGPSANSPVRRDPSHC
ncbi:MAG: SDR family NAD(P)-dependent oxidoreductase, partial [Acidimicrobiia bacterium]|nr:SDR family NAD(P)-dependent oxidoreductase [Acidimicrobiia bacterium]